MGFEIDVIGTAGTDTAWAVEGRSQGASLADLDERYRKLIDGPIAVTLATARSDGTPMLSVMWFQAHRDNEHFEINTVVGRVKDRQMQANPDVSIQIINPRNAYHHVTIYGVVADRIPEFDPERGHLATESIDAAAELYVKQRPYPFRVEGEERVLYLIRPTKIVTFGG